MPATFTIPLITVISGQLLTASLWNSEWENVDTNFVPAGMDDYSATDSEMRTTTDPYPASATSRPTSLQGEIERIRYVVAQLSGETYWYIDPVTTIAALYARFPIQTADIGDGQVTTAKIADSNVTTAKIADSNVTTAKIADSNVTTAKIADLNVTTGKIADSAVTTIKIADSNVTTAKIADSNVTTAKIADSNVTTAKIADSNVTNAKINDVAASKITGTIGTSQIADDAVTAAKIVDNVDLVGNVKASTSSCFLAYASGDQDNVTGNGTLYTVQFGTEAFDQNGDFNNSTHVFTAPVTGKYLFMVQVRINDAATGNKNELFLVTNNRTYTVEDWPVSNLTQVLTVIADMTAGHTAYVQVKGTGGALVEDVKASASVTGGVATFFSGKLIA